MDSYAASHARTAATTAPLPALARPRGPDIAESDAAFSAGITLKSLDDFVRHCQVVCLWSRVGEAFVFQAAISAV
ncbi:DUF1403 family protein [Martelella mediterranea]|uniref:DUF1403 family protein n=1 Tax=Martelella mediterranea TaxID=293089 RepID=UPI000A2F1317